MTRAPAKRNPRWPGPTKWTLLRHAVACRDEAILWARIGDVGDAPTLTEIIGKWFWHRGENKNIAERCEREAEAMR